MDVQLKTYLEERCVNSSKSAILSTLCQCTKQVAEILAETTVHVVGSANVFGDPQLTVDVRADDAIFDTLTRSSLVSFAASEEQPDMRELTPDGEFMVVFDPLDGSSIVDCNWSVGSIFGVFLTNSSHSLTGVRGRDQVMSAVSIYGPRTCVIVALPGVGAFETTLVNNEWVITSEFSSISSNAKIFSPANLRATQDLPGYQSLVNEWMAQRLTLRYTGGMVPDIASILLKGNGIFCSPVSAKAPAKLRLVFECAPIALIIETAGGAALNDGSGSPILDIPIKSMDERVGIVCGSSDEVNRAVSAISHYCTLISGSKLLFGVIPVVYVGIAILFVATTIATLGHVTMKIHTNHQHKLAQGIISPKHLWIDKRKYVTLAVVLYVVGGVIDVSLNRLVPFYIRACFAALDIPIYVILARVILREILHHNQQVGVLISVVGCACAVIAGAHTVVPRGQKDVLEDILSYRVGMLLAVTAPIFLGSVYVVRDTLEKQGPPVPHETAHGRMFLLICAVCASSYAATWASLLVRVVSELAHVGILQVSTLAMTTVLLLAALTQLATMSDMLAMFKSVVSMPFYLICNSAGIVILSGVVFNEVPSHPLLFGLAMAFGLVGIAFIVHKTPEEMEDDPDEEIGDEKENLVPAKSQSIKMRE